MQQGERAGELRFNGARLCDSDSSAFSLVTIKAACDIKHLYSPFTDQEAEGREREERLPAEREPGLRFPR